MNKKITFSTPSGKVCYCVFDGNEDYAKQAEKALGISPGYGLAVYWHENEFRLVDYYHADTIASFKILFMEDCDSDVSLKWTDAE